MTKFEQQMPFILGGLLDVLCEAHKALPGPQHPGLPRLADYGRYGAAICEVLGFGADRFLKALKENAQAHQSRTRSAARRLEPALDAILDLMSARGQFSGITSDLLKALGPYAPTGSATMNNWPDSPVKLGIALGRIQAELENAGVIVSTLPSKIGTHVTLEWKSTANVSDLPEEVDPITGEIPDFDPTLDAVEVMDFEAENDIQTMPTDAPVELDFTPPLPDPGEIPDAPGFEQAEDECLKPRTDWSKFEDCKFFAIMGNKVPHCGHHQQFSMLDTSECYGCEKFVSKSKPLPKSEDDEEGSYKSAF